MDHLMLFEKFGLTSGIKPHPQMEEFVRDRIGWNGGISDCLDVVSTKAMGIVKNGFVRTGTTTSTGEDALVKIITRFYFGRNTPKTVSSDLWDRYKRIWESYWRGVPEHRYVSDLAYDGSFTGGQNIYQGTWMTTDREYAAKYADQSDPDTLIHILKNPSMRIIGAVELQHAQNELRHLLESMMDDVSDVDDMDLYLYHSLKYTKDMLVNNATFMCIVNGYDAVRTLQSNVLVVFNKQKIAVRR